MNRINRINLNDLELKIFTEQDALDYCSVNNVDPDKVILLNLFNNELTDILGIKLFKNLKELKINNNEITDISVLKDLTKLEYLDISCNQIKNISVLKDLNNLKTLQIRRLLLESDQIKYIKSLKKLNTLWCYNGFKEDIILNKLNNKIKIY